MLHSKNSHAVDLSSVKAGLILAISMLAMNIGLGIAFGIDSEFFKNYIQAGISLHPDLFPAAQKDSATIWKMVQRAHYHAGGIGAYVLGMVVVTALTSMSEVRKRITSWLLGLTIFYPLALLAMFFYAPSVGRKAAHSVFLVELCTYIGCGGLVLGMLSLLSWLSFHKRSNCAA
ncbi:hypothetical protein ACVCGZ_05530 [Serratia nematodiphila]